jgi:Secretion system C-terminal sorting domain/Beta-propeller repeat
MKRLKSFLFLLIIISTFQDPSLYPQVQQVWVARYNNIFNGNDACSDIAVDRFGNVYVTGDAILGSQSNDYVTVKYNENGIQQWVRTYGAPSIIDLSKAIDLDDSGNVYVTGGGYTENSTNFDYVTIKYSPSGTQLWVARYNGPIDGSDGATDIAIDKKNRFIYVTGASAQFGWDGNKTHFLTIKYSLNGDTIWTRWYACYRWSSICGYAEDFATSIAVDDSGYVYVTGPSGLRCPPALYDYITIKYKPNGDSVWVRRYSTGNTGGDDYPKKVLVDSNGNVFVTGFSNDGSGTGDDFATVKYNKQGVQQWVMRYGWVQTDQAKSAALDKFGSIYVTGFSSDTGSHYDYATVKYSPAGTELWVRKYNGSGNSQDIAYDVAVDDSSNVYVTGNIINSSQNYEFATIKYNTLGVQQWIKNYPGGGDRIAVDSLRNVYVTGTNNLAGTGLDIITIKYSQLVGISSNNEQLPVQYKLYQNYPNPFNPVTKIKFDLPKSNLTMSEAKGHNVKLIIYDVLGREVAILVNKDLKPGTYVAEFDGSNLPSGIYFYTLETGDFRDTKKMILIK